MKRRAADMDPNAYGTDDWSLVESGLDRARMVAAQSLFTIGDGFLGIRGGFEEGLSDGSGGAETWLNGVYEHVPIRYHEKAHGFPETGDRRPRAPEATRLVITIDGERVAIDQGTVIEATRRLDFRTGQLERHVVWRSPKGRTLRFDSMRMAAMARPGLLAQSVTLSCDDDVLIEVETGVRMPPPPVSAANGGVHDPRIAPAGEAPPWGEADCRELDGRPGLQVTTRISGISVALVMQLMPDDAGEISRNVVRPDGAVAILKGKSRLAFSSLTAHTSNFGDSGRDAMAEAVALLDTASEDGWDALMAEQRDWLSDYWSGADLSFPGAPHLTQAVRYNMFELLQASGRGGHLSLCAKGQSGEGYEGHYFWDAEIFGLPLLALTEPLRARDMLMFRCRTLAQSRTNARMLGHQRGALIAWRTIGGRESSAYFPAGSAQYHINADIAHALRLYVDATGDRAFLFEHGAELLFETARIWLDIGHFNPRRGGAFTIHGVTGPDEYTALVNNNFYTNAMAATHLGFAVETAAAMAREAPEAWLCLKKAIMLDDGEPAGWQAAADAMYLPYDEMLGIHAQDDSFLGKPRWDIAGTPDDRFPLLLHYHPMQIYRHQVAKQADTVLAHVLLGDRFDRATMARSLNYYEGVTVHDSTLSAAAFSIAASMAGDGERAFRYFRDAALVDLADLHGNSGHGLHMASMGGSWMSVVMGFAGLRVMADHLAFSPALPEGLTGLCFRLRYRGSRLAILLGSEMIEYRLLAGSPVPISHHGERLLLADRPLSRPARTGKDKTL